MHIVDDDLALRRPAADLGFMLRVWSIGQNSRQAYSIVGPFRRVVRSNGKYGFDTNLYTFVLSGFSVVHRCVARTLAEGVDGGVLKMVRRRGVSHQPTPIAQRRLANA
jgi:hypothetical protein